MNIHHTTTLLLVVLVLIAALFLPKCNAREEVILEESFTILGDETITTENGNCRITLQNDGNLIVRRYNPSYGRFRVTWATGPFGAADEYTAILNSLDGRLIIWKLENGQQNVYSTVRRADPYYSQGDHPYRLVMDDEDCTLTILGQAEDEDGTYEVEIWQNIRRSMTNKDVMKKGDILRGFHWMCPCDEGRDHYYCASVPMYIILQGDCNIVQRIGHDRHDAGDVVWSAGGARPDLDDCYIYVDENFVGLFAGTFNESERDVTYPEREGLLWKTEDGNWEETELHWDQGFYAD